jgi:hypothetical protein
MKLSIIWEIQSQCSKRTRYSLDMQAFYSTLQTIHDALEAEGKIPPEGFQLTTSLSSKHIPTLEGYLNLFCEPAGYYFFLTKNIAGEQIFYDIRILPLK